MTYENHGRPDPDHDDRHDPHLHEPNDIAHDHPAEPDDPIDQTPAADDDESIEDMLELASNQVMGDGDDHGGDDGGDSDDEAEEAAAKAPKSSSYMIAKWIVANRVGDALQPIHAKSPHCLLIEVPEASWSEPIGEVIAEMIGRIGLLRHMSDLVITTDDIPRRDKTDRLKEKCIRIASRGDPLVIILNQPYQQLPREVTGLVDHHVMLTPLDSADLCAIIGEVSGSTVPIVVDDIASGLSFEQIAGGIRLNDTPESMINRLRAMRGSVSQTRSIAVPPLEELTGYGAAKDWGLRLSREIGRYRAGQIPLADLPRGLLLSGPPGCGKTLFAQSLAQTCSVPIIATSVAAWLQNGDGHLGDVMHAVKKIFDEAYQQQKPAILFLDECDAFIDPSKTRDRSNWWQTLRAGVLSSIDGASTEPGLIILGACNYPELVDPALRRSGRLDRHIQIPWPDAEALASMLQSALGDTVSDADYQRLGQLIIGSTGADVARYVREIRARARDYDRDITVDDIEAVLSPPDDRSPDLIRRVAFHESGHAVVAAALGREVKAVSLSIIAPGFGGYVLTTRPTMFTRTSIEDEVLIGLAGRASEVRFGLEASSGACADLVETTRLLVQAHGSYGFGSSLASVDENADVERILLADTRLKQIVDNDLHRLWKRALVLVEENMHAIRSVADRLIERRHLDGEEIMQIVARCRSGPALVTG